MADCIFCKIVAGEIPAAKVHEDELSVASLGQITEGGYTLLIPKAHHQMMSDTPDDLVAALYVTAKQLMVRIKQAMTADFVVLSVVGIDVPHFHIHLIPRHNSDGLANFWPTKKYAKGQIEAVADKIRSAS